MAVLVHSFFYMHSNTAHSHELQDRVERIATKCAKDKILDIMSNAAYQIIEETNLENQQLKAENEKLRADNERLLAIINACRIDMSKYDFPHKHLIPSKRGKKSTKSFRSLLQGNDIDSVLHRMHVKIDGKGGKDVAMVLLRAKADKLICRTPTEKEFESEFPNYIGTWRAISSYFAENKYIDISSVVI